MYMSLTCKDISDKSTAKSGNRLQANLPRVLKPHFAKNMFLNFMETTENGASKAPEILPVS